MIPLRIPDRYNYIACFLTLRCNLGCSYCINRFSPGESVRRERRLEGATWVNGLNRITSRPDLPVTLQGGEPSLHPDFIEIINGVRPDLSIDLLTNLTFDVERFAREVRPERLRRDAPYASIRVSYHPETMALAPLVEKVLYLQRAGFSVGIWGVLHPAQSDEILDAQRRCREQGIDFRTKEFLGYHAGVLHGQYLYPDACSGKAGRRVLCRTTELLMGPGGEVFRCHADLYRNRSPVGSIADPTFQIDERFRPCEDYGGCNPCDVKVKTNRFQQFGHTSVEIVADGERTVGGDPPHAPGATT